MIFWNFFLNTACSVNYNLIRISHLTVWGISFPFYSLTPVFFFLKQSRIVSLGFLSLSVDSVQSISLNPWVLPSRNSPCAAFLHLCPVTRRHQCSVPSPFRSPSYCWFWLLASTCFVGFYIRTYACMYVCIC